MFIISMIQPLFIEIQEVKGSSIPETSAFWNYESVGNITGWLWNFGDGETSTEKNPIHQFRKPDIRNTIWLDVEGPDGKSRHSKHWDVSVK